MRNKPIPATLLLLAGGKGSRMGGNKLYLSHDGLPLIDRLLARTARLFAGAVLAVGAGEAPRVWKSLAPVIDSYNITVAEDRARGRGPLEGLFNSLSAARTEWGFLYACDMPAPQEAAIRTLWSLTPGDCDVSAVCLDGYLSATHAFYRKTCLQAVDETISGALDSGRGGAKIISFYEKTRLNVVREESFAHLPGWKRSFGNVNTREELREALTELEEGGARLF